MIRSVSTDIALTASAGAAQHALMVAVARVPGLRVADSLHASLDGEPLEAVPVPGPHHAVVHLLDLPASTPADAPLTVAYRARVEGTPSAGSNTSDVYELLAYLRPSRYAESDHLSATARSEFGGVGGTELVAAVTAWVRRRLAYVPGASRATDGAVETLLARAGVCRDFAHLVVALLRALDVPARLVAVYAPGLSPMDFHAVAEAWVEGEWHVVDATGLAPRQSLVRIATGRDAADTAFLSSYGAPARLDRLDVLAVVDGDLPLDDHRSLMRLG